MGSNAPSSWRRLTWFKCSRETPLPRESSPRTVTHLTVRKGFRACKPYKAFYTNFSSFLTLLKQSDFWQVSQTLWNKAVALSAQTNTYKYKFHHFNNGNPFQKYTLFFNVLRVIWLITKYKVMCFSEEKFHWNKPYFLLFKFACFQLCYEPKVRAGLCTAALCKSSTGGKTNIRLRNL